jgi:hypothetical protein
VKGVVGLNPLTRSWELEVDRQVRQDHSLLISFYSTYQGSIHTSLQGSEVHETSENKVMLLNLFNHWINNFLVGRAFDYFSRFGPIAWTSVCRIANYRRPLSFFWTFVSCNPIKDGFIVVDKVAKFRSYTSAINHETSEMTHRGPSWVSRDEHKSWRPPLNHVQKQHSG